MGNKTKSEELSYGSRLKKEGYANLDSNLQAAADNDELRELLPYIDSLLGYITENLAESRRGSRLEVLEMSIAIGLSILCCLKQELSYLLPITIAILGCIMFILIRHARMLMHAYTTGVLEQNKIGEKLNQLRILNGTSSLTMGEILWRIHTNFPQNTDTTPFNLVEEDLEEYSPTQVINSQGIV